MRRMFVALVAVVLSMVFPQAILAQGEATGLFLIINPGARQGGMGEAGVALANDVNAIYWNPAGLAFQYDDPQHQSRGEATIMHVDWLPQFNLSDLYYDFAAARYYLEGIGNVGFSIQFMNYGSITVTGEKDPTPIGEFTSNEMAFTGSYGVKVKDNLGVGVNLKFVYSRLSPLEGVAAEKGKGIGSTFALDLGVLYHPGFSKRLSLGLNVSNIGPKITYIDKEQADPIPTNLRLGMAYKLLDSEFNKLTFVYDVNRLLVPRDEEKRVESFMTYFFSTWGDGSDQFKRLTHSLGLEYWYTNLIALRSGFFYEDPDYGGRKFWTFGGGVYISFFGVDFSYILASVDDHPLADTMRFSLLAKF
ncbi:MAG: hypothetical protein D6748_04565 [Calditrichaeota bacterium]|nr:MAG: hypothetical protein D6748_04565 [Calditrichota bacterium]